MARTKVTDEQILEVLQDPQYTSERQRCMALGISVSGSNGDKFKKLREQHGIPEPEKGKPGKKAAVKEQLGALKIDDIRKDDRLMKDGKRLIVMSVVGEVAILKRMDGSTFQLTAKQFNAFGYTKVPPGDPQGSPVKTYIDPSLKANDIKVNGQPIKNLPDSVKEKIADKLREDKARLKKNFEFAAKVLEEDACDSLQEQPAFEDVDYVDPAHGFDKVVEIVPSRREYLDRIDQLLSLTIQDCTGLEMATQVTNLAALLLDRGITAEIEGLLEEAGV